MWILKTVEGEVVIPGMEISRPGQDKTTFLSVEQPPSAGRSGKVVTSRGVFFPAVFRLTFESTEWTQAERLLESNQELFRELVRRLVKESATDPSEEREVLLDVTRAELAAFIATWNGAYEFKLVLK